MSASTVTLFSGLALKDLYVHEILPESPDEVETVFAPTSVLVSRIRAGDRPDILVGVRDPLRELAAESILDSTTLRPLVRSGLGVATLPDAPAPALGSAEEFVSSLRSARSVAYSRSGASGLHFSALLERLGIAEEVNSRATLVPGGFTGEALLDGRADLAIQQVIELRSVDGIRIAGSFPDELQHYVDLWIGGSPRLSDSKAAERLWDILVSPTAAAAYGAAGLEWSD